MVFFLCIIILLRYFSAWLAAFKKPDGRNVKTLQAWVSCTGKTTKQEKKGCHCCSVFLAEGQKQAEFIKCHFHCWVVCLSVSVVVSFVWESLCGAGCVSRRHVFFFKFTKFCVFLYWDTGNIFCNSEFAVLMIFPPRTCFCSCILYAVYAGAALAKLR